MGLDLDEKEKFKVTRFFMALSTTPDADQISIGIVFLTEESIMNNCKEYFGHPCEFFSKRFYDIIAENVSMKRIFFKDYIEKFYNILIKAGNNNRTRSSFIFKMIDFDQDGELSAIDLLNTFEQISVKSKFGREVHTLMQWFTAKNVS